jgi:hypothetical protein
MDTLPDADTPPADGDELGRKTHHRVTAAARRKLTGLDLLDEARQENLLGKWGAHPRGYLAGDGDGLAPQPLDDLNRPVHVGQELLRRRDAHAVNGATL